MTSRRPRCGGLPTRVTQGYMHLESAPSLPGQYADAGWAASPLNNCSSPAAQCADGKPPPATVHVYSPKQWFEACTW